MYVYMWLCECIFHQKTRTLIIFMNNYLTRNQIGIYYVYTPHEQHTTPFIILLPRVLYNVCVLLVLNFFSFRKTIVQFSSYPFHNIYIYRKKIAGKTLNTIKLSIQLCVCPFTIFFYLQPSCLRLYHTSNTTIYNI